MEKDFIISSFLLIGITICVYVIYLFIYPKNDKGTPKMKKNNRYFLVFYSGICENNSLVNGYCDFTTNGYYLNGKKIVSELMKVQKRKVTSLVLTNIVELSISDFKDWSSDLCSTCE